MAILRSILASLFLVAGFMLAIPPAAQSAQAPAVPAWRTPTASVGTSPRTIVAHAPRGRDLQVVVTRQTLSGPQITTKTVGTPAEAERVVGQAQSTPGTLAVGMAQPVGLEAITNDTESSQQYSLTTLVAGLVWDLTHGGGVTVGVIDTGVRGSNPDLSGQVLAGWDVNKNTATGNSDSNGHGTHVAGIIAAIANNHIGVAGLAPAAKILPVKIVDSSGRSNTAGMAEGILWATAHGAKVINISMGGSVIDDNLNTAVQYAYSRNVVVVAAAGNEKLNGNKPHYPAAFPNVVGVGATDSSNHIGSFSNTGSYVDVAAPGVRIWSTYLSSFAMMTGTSMATPYVSATAALAVAAKGSGYTAPMVTGWITGTSRDLGSAGRDNTYGNGLVSPISIVRLAKGIKLPAKIAASVPTDTIRGGSSKTVTGRLRTTYGANLSGRNVTITATYGGTSVSKVATTDSLGRASATFNPTTKATFKFAFAGDTTTAATSVSSAFSKVVPNLAIVHSGRSLTITNKSSFGVDVRVQTKTSSGWSTYSRKVGAFDTWTTTLRKGTNRVYSATTTSFMTWISPSWGTS